jgi:3-deoxy-D-arabino-heptulosonate 7-phosphate (DAHP) synthase
MLEVHSNPAVALSDGEQQLDLPGFDRLLESLGFRGPG